MPYHLVKVLESENWIKLSGKLTVQDFQSLQTLDKDSRELFGQVRLLEDFPGWSREPGWADSFFLTKTEGRTARLVLVGDEKWKDEAFLFTGKPMRQTAIELFPPDRLAEAKAWLAEGLSQTLFRD